MRISRLYVAMPLVLNETITLDEESGHYLRSVLRLKRAHIITLFNGKGNEYRGLVIEISRKRVLIEVQSLVQCHVESTLQLVLGLGVSRGSRMDIAVQKSVELGVAKITPLQTERCVVQFNAEKGEHKINHWQKIAQHASEQSGRTTVPEIASVDSLERWAKQQSGLKVFLDPFASQTLPQLSPANNLVTLLAGPEGGFSTQERVIAQQAGFIPVQLGPRILRTETAALAAITSVQLLWGDLGTVNA